MPDPLEAAVRADGADAWQADAAEPLGPRARLFPALAAVYRAQLSRARVARIPLLFVATFQSVGIMILMRGVVDGGDEARAVVAGSSVLVVAFVALNLLAQYFGQLRAGGGLDHYATLPVPPGRRWSSAPRRVRLVHRAGHGGHGGRGCLLFQLPMANLWVLAAVIPLAGAALAGLGAALGLLAPRPELATLLGQLGMSAALLLGVLPAGRMPELLQWARDLLPSTYGVEAFARTFGPHPDWALVVLDLARVRGRRRRLARRRHLGLPPGGRPVRGDGRAVTRLTVHWHDGGVTAPLTPSQPPRDQPPHDPWQRRSVGPEPFPAPAHEEDGPTDEDRSAAGGRDRAVAVAVWACCSGCCGCGSRRACR